MPKIDIEAIPQSNATGYPEPFNEPVQGRWWRRLAPAGKLSHIGASHVVLKPGAWSSQRHWHEAEDEMVIMLSGEAVLIEDGGETILRAGDVAAWAAAVQNGHRMENRTDIDCAFIAISAGDKDGGGEYSDIDMMFAADGYFRKDGKPYPSTRIK